VKSSGRLVFKHGVSTLSLDLTAAFDVLNERSQSTDREGMWLLETSRLCRWVNALVLEPTGVEYQYRRIGFTTFYAEDAEDWAMATVEIV
jgi:hypothetical protein